MYVAAPTALLQQNRALWQSRARQGLPSRLASSGLSRGGGMRITVTTLRRLGLMGLLSVAVRRGGRLTLRGGRPGSPVDRLAGLRQRLSRRRSARPSRCRSTTTQPSRATTPLALARFPATDAEHRIGTVFVNPGGPGGSGVGLVLDGFGEYLRDNLGGRFDVVGFDPRGIGASDPLALLRQRGRPDPVPLGGAAVPVRADASTGRSTTISPRSPAGA